MSVVSWGAPTIQIIPVTAGTAPETGSWDDISGLITIPGDILLENSSQLNTTEGDTRTVKNEKGEDVDSKKLPASYSANTSIIKKKADTVWAGIKTALAAVNGVCPGLFAMRLIAEDPQAVGFSFRKCTISCAKGWDSQQGALEVITFNALVPDTTDKEICVDYSVPAPTPEPDPEG